MNNDGKKQGYLLSPIFFREEEHSEKNNEERKREKHEAVIMYIYANLSGIDLIESSAYIQIKIRNLNVR